MKSQDKLQELILNYNVSEFTYWGYTDKDLEELVECLKNTEYFVPLETIYKNMRGNTCAINKEGKVIMYCHDVLSAFEKELFPNNNQILIWD